MSKKEKTKPTDAVNDVPAITTIAVPNDSTKLQEQDTKEQEQDTKEMLNVLLKIVNRCADKKERFQTKKLKELFKDDFSYDAIYKRLGNIPDTLDALRKARIKIDMHSENKFAKSTIAKEIEL